MSKPPPSAWSWLRAGWVEYKASARIKLAALAGRKPKASTITPTTATTATTATSTTSTAPSAIPTVSKMVSDAEVREQVSHVAEVGPTLRNPLGVIYTPYNYEKYHRLPFWKRPFEGSRFVPGRTFRPVIYFNEQTTLEDWIVNDDQEFGGQSAAKVSVNEVVQPDGTIIHTFVFEGEVKPLRPFAHNRKNFSEDRVNPIPLKLHDRDRESVGPTGLVTPPGYVDGFCSCISPPYELPDLDLSAFDYLKLRFRTDGRAYYFNVRCREMLPIVYVGRIPAEHPETASHFRTREIRFQDLLATNDGETRTAEFNMPRKRIDSLGFSVNGPPGPFRLELEMISAHTGLAFYQKRGRTKWEIFQLESMLRWDHEKLKILRPYSPLFSDPAFNPEKYGLNTDYSGIPLSRDYDFPDAMNPDMEPVDDEIDEDPIYEQFKTPKRPVEESKPDEQPKSTHDDTQPKSSN